MILINAIPVSDPTCHLKKINETCHYYFNSGIVSILKILEYPREFSIIYVVWNHENRFVSVDGPLSIYKSTKQRIPHPGSNYIKMALSKSAVNVKRIYLFPADKKLQLKPGNIVTVTVI